MQISQLESIKLCEYYTTCVWKLTWLSIDYEIQIA